MTGPPGSSKGPLVSPRGPAGTTDTQTDPSTPIAIRPGDLVRDRRLGGELFRVGSIVGDTALCSRPRSRGTAIIPLADLVLEAWDLARRVHAALPADLGVDLDIVRVIVGATVAELGEVS